MRLLRDYEKRLFEEYMINPSLSLKSEWIRESLKILPQSSYDLHIEYERFVEILCERHGLNIKSGDYDGMRRMIWMLKKLGLVEIKEKEKTKQGRVKHIYHVVDYESNKWNNPQKQLYGDYK